MGEGEGCERWGGGIPTCTMAFTLGVWKVRRWGNSAGHAHLHHGLDFGDASVEEGRIQLSQRDDVVLQGREGGGRGRVRGGGRGGERGGRGGGRGEGEGDGQESAQGGPALGKWPEDEPHCPLARAAEGEKISSTRTVRSTKDNSRNHTLVRL